MINFKKKKNNADNSESLPKAYGDSAHNSVRRDGQWSADLGGQEQLHTRPILQSPQKPMCRNMEIRKRAGTRQSPMPPHHESSGQGKPGLSWRELDMDIEWGWRETAGPFCRVLDDRVKPNIPEDGTRVLIISPPMTNKQELGCGSKAFASPISLPSTKIWGFWILLQGEEL